MSSAKKAAKRKRATKTKTLPVPRRTKRAAIVAEHPIEGVERIAGVTHDGERVWIADMTRGGLVAVDPETGRTVRRLVDIPAEAGTAFDGSHIYQLTAGRIRKVDPSTGAIMATLDAPAGVPTGLAYAAGALWVGDWTGRSIRKIDPATGRVLKTIRSDRFVTGVTWAGGDLWHGTDGDTTSELRKVDPDSGEVLERLELPKGVHCSGLEADGEGRLWFGDRTSGNLRAAKRPAS